MDEFDKTVRLDGRDNIVTAIQILEEGTVVEGVTATDRIPRGHKIAVTAIAKDEPVFKYAQLIGYAAEDIAVGSHVHTHNLEFRNVEQEYEFSTDLRPVTPASEIDTFMGFRRENGRSGTRNYIAVLTSVNCSASAAHMIANHFTPEIMAQYPNVDGVVAFAQIGRAHV